MSNDYYDSTLVRGFTLAETFNYSSCAVHVVNQNKKVTDRKSPAESQAVAVHFDCSRRK